MNISFIILILFVIPVVIVVLFGSKGFLSRNKNDPKQRPRDSSSEDGPSGS